MSQQEQAQVEASTVEEIPEEISEKQLRMLVGFRDLVAERFAYETGRSRLRGKLSDLTEEERKAVNEISSNIDESIPEWIENSNLEEYNQQTEQLEQAKEERKQAKKATGLPPKISNLRKAVSYLDSVTIPDALHALGKPLQARFSLSEKTAEIMRIDDVELKETHVKVEAEANGKIKIIKTEAED